MGSDLLELVMLLSLTPLGFFGMLGGLGGGMMGGMMGGGGKGGGGLLGGLLNNQKSGGGAAGGGAPPPGSRPQQQQFSAAQETAGQTAAEQQPVQQPIQPAEKPMVTQTADTISEGQQTVTQKKAEQKNPLSGLLEETKVAADTPAPQKDQVVQAPDAINKTEDSTPVAKMQGESLGDVPQVDAPEIVQNQLFDSATNKQPFEYQSGLPDRDISDTLADSEFTSPQGYQYQQQTTVGGGLPAMKYGLRR